MKTRSWILLLGLLALCLLAVVLVQQLAAKPAARAELWVDGVLVKTVDLSEDQRFTIEAGGGYNVIEVKDGRIRVAEADCKGGDCVKTGAKRSGVPIICLPHRLVIRFSDRGAIDGLAG